MAKKNPERFIYYPKWIQLILLLQENDTLTKLSRKTNHTYSYTHLTCGVLAKRGVIKQVKHGRECLNSLTKKGIVIQGMLRMLQSELEPAITLGGDDFESESIKLS